MVIRATSDLHLTVNSVEYVMNALDELRKDSWEHGGHTVLPGDILDQPDSLPVREFMRLRARLQTFGGTVWVIAGNHDQYDTDGNSALELLKGGRVRVITRPTFTAIGRMIPYTKPDAFKAAFKACGEWGMIDRDPLPFVWCHHTFRSAYMNNTRRSTEGVNWRHVSADLLFISGHFHMPQVLGNVIYCGSPYQVSFSEEGQEKGWLRWEDPHSERIPERVPYKAVGAPQHYTIEWDPRQGPPERPDGISERDIVRVRALATREEASKAISQLEAVGLSSAPIQTQRVAGNDARSEVRGLSPREAAEEIVKDSEVDPFEAREWAEENLWAS